MSKRLTIVTTTIQPPTEATIEFFKKVRDNPDWRMVVAGDTKTDPAPYQLLADECDRFSFLSFEEQETRWRELSDLIGPRSIQRRNFGFLKALSDGCDVVATVDDDNIPYPEWGNEILVGETIQDMLAYNTVNDVFDPLSATNHPELWHRGYPHPLRSTRARILKYRTECRCLVQANLWDGDPDIDAIQRIVSEPLVMFDKFEPFTTPDICPFNSQNTMLSAKIMPYYMVLPHVGRMDDIWGAYILQSYLESFRKLTDTMCCVAFGQATVRQDRNQQDLLTNLQNEIEGYRKTPLLVKEAREGPAAILSGAVLPQETIAAFRAYNAAALSALETASRKDQS